MFECARRLTRDCELNVLLPFNATYLCEINFSVLTHIKSQYRSSLKNVEEILRPAVLNIAPRFNLLCRKKQVSLINKQFFPLIFTYVVCMVVTYSNRILSYSI